MTVGFCLFSQPFGIVVFHLPVAGFAEAQAEPLIGDGVKTGERFRVETVQAQFGDEDEMTRVHISGLEVPRPFQVGIYRFRENCGLYFIAGFSDDSLGEKVRTLAEAVGMSGIGGRVSSGLGKYRIEDCVFLNEFFDTQTEWLFSASRSILPRSAFR